MFSHSATDDGVRGTAKYFSPEMAAYEKSGRASDIFSLGCILLEMTAVMNGYSLQSLKELRQDKDCSFHANLSSTIEWFDYLSVSLADIFLLCEVRMMLRSCPQSRPTIQHVSERVQLLSHFLRDDQSFQSHCCDRMTTTPLPGYLNDPYKISTIRITLGNTHQFLPENDRYVHGWTFFIWPSNPDMIEKIYCFKVRSC
jgi:serine/threonine protein kinase